MKTYVIGDVHGCGVELRQLLKEMKVQPGVDIVYLVGDLFDRGMYSHLVWELIRDYGMICIMGNHERKLARMIRGDGGYYPNYYHWTRANMNFFGIEDEHILKFIDNMPLLHVLEDPKVIVTHGGVLLTDPKEPNVSANTYGSLDEHQPMPRPLPGDPQTFWWDHYNGDHLVLYGHIVTHDFLPRFRNNSIGLDTACCHGGRLTAYCVETGMTHSVPAVIDWHAKLVAQLKDEVPV